MTQDQVIQMIKDGHNVFVTGGAGRGKSHLIRQIVDNTTILCAPTGIAALNIGGITCHKAFGLPTTIPTKSDRYKVSHKTRELFKKSSPIKRIVFDEVSMIRRDYLELIDDKLKDIRQSNEPFGGIQVVVVGDFLQLAPVLTSQEARTFYKEWSSIYGFTSDSWQFINVELTHCYRQDNPEQVLMLDSIRKALPCYKESLDKIIKMSKPYVMDKNVTHLCSRKNDVAMYNKMFYNQIDAQEQNYQAVTTGQDVFGNEPIVPRKLSLKVGCRVIIKANDQNGMYANGEMGTVTALYKSCVDVLKDNGIRVTVGSNKWSAYDYETANGELVKKEIGSYSQIPLMLGYAITIHSCQGTTLDSVAIDTGGDGCFTHGQLYVALSRVRDLTNISFASEIDYDEVLCDDEVLDFYDKIQTIQT